MPGLPSSRHERPTDPRALAGAKPERHAYVLMGHRSDLEKPQVREALRELRALGYAVQPQSMTERARGEAPPAEGSLDLVVAAGGDGTVREAAAEAYRQNALLVVFPLGTANDLARTLGIPLEIASATRLLRQGYRRRIDLGRCNGRIFCNVASVGLSAKVASRLSGDRKKRWGPLAYVRELLDAARARRAFRVRLEMDGREVAYRAMQVGVASGETQGGGTRVSPTARIDDGVFCVYVIEPQGLTRLVVMALSLKVGAHDIWRGAHFFESRRVRLETSRPRRIDVDGDLVERTPAEFELLPGAIEVLVPPDARQSREAR
jgi:YegS/Rv2252/BmrU family lipid kinase